MDFSDQFDLYYTKALRFLSHRPRSTKEVRDNLLKKKADLDIIDGVIKLLTKQKFLNDTEFASWWVKQRVEFRPKSISVMKMELYQKGIDTEIVTKVLSEPDEKINEEELVKSIIAKKFPRYQFIDQKIAKQKLSQLLMRRGFNWDIISRAIDDSFK